MTTLTIDDQHDARSAKPWFPYRKEGAGQPDTVTGVVVAIDSVFSDYHEGSRLKVVLRADDGAFWDVRTYPTRLHDELLAVRPQIGEVASVRFTGMRERKKDGKEYPDFSVAVERDTPAAFDYGRVGATVAPKRLDAPFDGDPVASTADGATVDDGSDIPY